MTSSSSSLSLPLPLSLSLSLSRSLSFSLSFSHSPLLIGKKSKKGFLRFFQRKQSPDGAATPSSRGEDDDDDDDEWSSEGAASASATPPKKQTENKIKVKRAHTNALVLSLSNLGTSQDEPASSAPIFCSECKAVLSSLSRLTTSDGMSCWDW